MNSTKDIINVALSLIISGLLVYDAFFSEKITSKQIENIMQDYDSKRESYQAKDSTYQILIDSLSSLHNNLNKELQDIRYQNYKTRQSNEKTYKKLDSLTNATGNRPNF